MQSKTGALAAPSAGTPAHESPAGGEHGKPWAEFPRRSCAWRRAPAREHKPASERPGPGERQRPHRHPCAGPTFPPGTALPRPRQARGPRGRPYDGGLEPRGHRSPRPPLWKVTRTPGHVGACPAARVRDGRTRCTHALAQSKDDGASSTAGTRWQWAQDMQDKPPTESTRGPRLRSPESGLWRGWTQLGWGPHPWHSGCPWLAVPWLVGHGGRGWEAGVRGELDRRRHSDPRWRPGWWPGPQNASGARTFPCRPQPHAP